MNRPAAIAVAAMLACLPAFAGIVACTSAPASSPHAPADSNTPPPANASPDSAATTEPEPAPHSEPAAPANASAVKPAQPWPDLAPAGARVQQVGTNDDGRGPLDLLTDGDALFAEFWARRITRILAHMREVFPPATADAEAPVRVLIFADAARFAAYAAHFAPENAHVLGYFDPDRREIVTAWRQAESRLVGTLLHEVTHLVLRDFLGHRFPPTWLDEGLATYYETGVFTENGDLVFGAIHPDYARLAAEWLPHVRTDADIRALAVAGFAEFNDETDGRRQRNYALSWSLVYFLLHGDRGLYHNALHLYLAQIAAQPDVTMRYPQAFDTCLSPQLPGFKAGWRLWASSAAPE